MILRARWSGEPPELGEFLMSQIRPRYAYRVTAVDRTDEKPYGEVNHFAFTVERIPARDIPPGARVHAWRWDSRSKSGGAGWSKL